MKLNSYPTVYAIGHKAITGLFSGNVIVEEKVDGSQFSFGVIDGELMCRSKGKQMILDAPDGMFVKAVSNVRLIAPSLKPNYIYRCEYLQKPKHNTLEYSRVPAMNLIGFDICSGLEEYLTPEEKRDEFQRIELECVPLLFVGVVENYETFAEFLNLESILGGSKIEGVVVKNYSLFTAEKKVAMGKYVSENFKELHEVDWKQRNPTGKDVTQYLIDRYKTESRYQKAIQHLKEDGILESSPRDIGLLIREIQADVLKECEDEIKNTLFSHYWKQIQRGIVSGFPEWYKSELAKTAFEDLT